MPHGPEHHQDPPLEEPIPPNRRGGGGKGQFLKQNVELLAENGGRRVAYLVRPSMPATASPRLPGSERPPPRCPEGPSLCLSGCRALMGRNPSFPYRHRTSSLAPRLC